MTNQQLTDVIIYMYVCMYIYIHTIIYLCTMFIQLTTEKTLAGKEWALISSRALQVCLHHRVVNNLTQMGMGQN